MKFIIAQIQLLIPYLYKQIGTMSIYNQAVEKDIFYTIESDLMGFQTQQYEHYVPFISFAHIKNEATTMMAHSRFNNEYLLPSRITEITQFKCN